MLVQVAYEETPIIDALHKFVYKRVSALPIVDSEVRSGVAFAKWSLSEICIFYIFLKILGIFGESTAKRLIA